MNEWKLPWTGACMCGGIRFQVNAAPMLTSVCHCTGCQKMSAGAFSLTVVVPSQGFTITQGEPAIGALHGRHKHLYCPHCKNWMFTRPEGMDFLVNIRASMLDDHSWIVPFVEVNTLEGFPWARTGATHSFASQPTEDRYQPLMDEFARQGARPK